MGVQYAMPKFVVCARMGGGGVLTFLTETRHFIGSHCNTVSLSVLFVVALGTSHYITSSCVLHSQLFVKYSRWQSNEEAMTAVNSQDD